MTDDTAPNAELVIPEDIGSLSNDDLALLTEQATKNFDDVFGDGSGMNSDELAALSALTEAIEALAAEQSKRDAEQAQRDELAAELAAKAGHLSAATEEGDKAAEEEPPAEDEEEADEEETPEDEGAADTVVASSSREIRVNLSGVRSRQKAVKPVESQPKSIKDVLLSAGVPNMYAAGEGINWEDAARSVDRRLTSFNQSQYEAARHTGRHVREQLGIAMVRKPLGDDHEDRVRRLQPRGQGVEACGGRVSAARWKPRCFRWLARPVRDDLRPVRTGVA